MTEESRPTGEAEYEDREDDFEDERDYEYDEAMPLLLLWEQEQSRVHPGFWEALDTLVEAGCQRYHVVYLLHRLPEADFVEKASKDDITTTLADLSRAIEALQRLRAKQLLPLLGPLTRQHWSVLRWLEQTSDEVRKLEITAHGGKSLLVEQLKAALVSHVMDATKIPTTNLCRFSSKRPLAHRSGRSMKWVSSQETRTGTSIPMEKRRTASGEGATRTSLRKVPRSARSCFVRPMLLKASVSPSGCSGIPHLGRGALRL